MEFIIYIIGGIFISVATILAFLHFKFLQKKPIDKKNFYNEIKKISKGFEEEKKVLQEKREKELENLLKDTKEKERELERVFIEKKEQIEFKIMELEEQFLNSAAEREVKISAEIQQSETKKYQELQRLENEHKEIINELKQDCLKTKELYENTKEELNQKIKELREEQNNLIEHLKKQESIKEKQDFYRLQITAAEQEDIEKLKVIATQLNNSTILYKLIWENYYKNSFNAMVGRVLPKTTICGIYKITEIETQKCYIGQGVDLKKRWNTHCRRGIKAEIGTANRLYTELFNKGLENFTFEIVEEVSKDKLTERERFWIRS